MEEAAKRFGPMMMKSMFIGMGALSKAFYERCGREAIPIIAEVSSQSGARRAKIMQQLMPVKNMKVVGEQLKMMTSMMGTAMEIIELSDDMVHFKVPQCTLGIEGTSKELCEAIMTSDRKAAEMFLGQEVEMKILKSIAAGDKECEVIFSKK